METTKNILEPYDPDYIVDGKIFGKSVREVFGLGEKEQESYLLKGEEAYVKKVGILSKAIRKRKLTEGSWDSANEWYVICRKRVLYPKWVPTDCYGSRNFRKYAKTIENVAYLYVDYDSHEYILDNEDGKEFYRGKRCCKCMDAVDEWLDFNI